VATSGIRAKDQNGDVWIKILGDLHGAATHSGAL